MAEDNRRDGLMRSLERMRATAGNIETELVELHNIVRFDHRSEGARERAARLETKLAQLAGAVRDFKEHCGPA